jgi:hypothetical protein
MVNTYNPVLSGIMTAYGLADRIRQAAQDEQRFKFEQERESRYAEQQKQQAERQKEDAERQELLTRIALAKDPSLVEVGAEGVRPVDLTVTEDMRRYVPGGSVRMGVPVENAVEYQGKRYAVRPEEELENRALGVQQRQAEAELGQKIRQSIALQQATAVPLPPGVAELYGYSPESPVPASLWDKLVTGATRISTEQAAERRAAEAEAGRNRRATEAEAGRDRRAARTGGEGSLAAERLKLSQQAAQRQQLVDLEGREDKAAKAVADLRAKIANNRDEKGKVLDAKLDKLQQIFLSKAEATLRRIREQKVAKGFTTQEDAFPPEDAETTAPAPAPSAQKKPVKPTVDSMSAKYGIP